ncbi:MAG: hypothetical protein ACLP22_18275 [Solirubrobacteraceae bacterium]
MINVLRSLNPSTARLHLATCHTIRIPTRGKSWTGQYVKLCSKYIHDLDAWAVEEFGAPFTRCGVCRPGTRRVAGDR